MKMFKFKKIIAVILSLVMVLSLMPAFTAFAGNNSITFDENTGDPYTLPPDTGIIPFAFIYTISNDIPVHDFGYPFLGWSTNPAAITPEYTVGDSIIVNGEIILYAIWNKTGTPPTPGSEYTLAYDATGGVPVPSTRTFTVPTYTNVSSLMPTNPPAIFQYWVDFETMIEYNPGDPIYVDAQIVLTAIWSNSEYTVTFVDSKYGSPAAAPQSVIYGDQAEEPDEPVLAHYLFQGWFTEDGTDDEWGDEWDFDDPIKGDIELFAKWAPKMYNVSYVYNNGALGGDRTESWPYGHTFPYNWVPSAGQTPEGQIFAGWYEDEYFAIPWYLEDDPYFPASEVSGPVTLYARWEGDEFQISFLIPDGTFPAAGWDWVECASGAEFYGDLIGCKPSTDPSIAGYNFDGWFKDEAYTEEWDFLDDTVVGDTELFAKFTQFLTVKFWVDGTEITAWGLTVLPGTKITAPTPEPIKSGYAFAGWVTNLSTLAPWNFAVNVVNVNRNLYATWTVEKCGLTLYHFNDADEVEELEVDFESVIPTTWVAHAPKYGHEFADWYKNYDDITDTYSNPWTLGVDQVIEPTILYAKWTPLPWYIDALEWLDEYGWLLDYDPDNLPPVTAADIEAAIAAYDALPEESLSWDCITHLKEAEIAPYDTARDLLDAMLDVWPSGADEAQPWLEKYGELLNYDPSTHVYLPTLDETAPPMLSTDILDGLDDFDALTPTAQGYITERITVTTPPYSDSVIELLEAQYDLFTVRVGAVSTTVGYMLKVPEEGVTYPIGSLAAVGNRIVVAGTAVGTVVRYADSTYTTTNTSALADGLNYLEAVYTNGEHIRFIVEVNRTKPALVANTYIYAEATTFFVDGVTPEYYCTSTSTTSPTPSVANVPKSNDPITIWVKFDGGIEPYDPSYWGEWQFTTTGEWHKTNFTPVGTDWYIKLVVDDTLIPGVTEYAGVFRFRVATPYGIYSDIRAININYNHTELVWVNENPPAPTPPAFPGLGTNPLGNPFEAYGTAITLQFNRRVTLDRTFTQMISNITDPGPTALTSNATPSVITFTPSTSTTSTTTANGNYNIVKAVDLWGNEVLINEMFILDGRMTTLPALSTTNFYAELTDGRTYASATTALSTNEPVTVWVKLDAATGAPLSYIEWQFGADTTWHTDYVEYVTVGASPFAKLVVEGANVDYIGDMRIRAVSYANVVSSTIRTIRINYDSRVPAAPELVSMTALVDPYTAYRSTVALVFDKKAKVTYEYTKFDGTPTSTTTVPSAANTNISFSASTSTNGDYTIISVTDEYGNTYPLSPTISFTIDTRVSQLETLANCGLYADALPTVEATPSLTRYASTSSSVAVKSNQPVTITVDTNVMVAPGSTAPPAYIQWQFGGTSGTWNDMDDIDALGFATLVVGEDPLLQGDEYIGSFYFRAVSYSGATGGSARYIYVSYRTTEPVWDPANKALILAGPVAPMTVFGSAQLEFDRHVTLSFRQDDYDVGGTYLTATYKTAASRTSAPYTINLPTSTAYILHHYLYSVVDDWGNALPITNSSGYNPMVIIDARAPNLTLGVTPDSPISWMNWSSSTAPVIYQTPLSPTVEYVKVRLSSTSTAFTVRFEYSLAPSPYDWQPVSATGYDGAFYYYDIPRVNTGLDQIVYFRSVYTENGVASQRTVTIKFEETTELDEGDGTEFNPYIIYNAGQLAFIAERVNDNDPLYNESWYLLANDIDLSAYGTGAGWVPIGLVITTPFKGVFDGDGHKITGLKIDSTASENSGLFSRIDGATIKNLDIVGANITAISTAGGLAG